MGICSRRKKGSALKHSRNYMTRWIEVVKDTTWKLEESDTYISKRKNYFYIYDNSHMEIKFPLDAFFENPFFNFLEENLALKNRIAQLKTEVDYLYQNPSTQFLDLVARTELEAYKMVSLEGVLADNSRNINLYSATGIILQNKNFNELARLQLSGVVENPLWNFTPKRNLFLLNNSISETPVNQNSKFIQKIGFSLSPTKILISMQQPIQIN